MRRLINDSSMLEDERATPDPFLEKLFEVLPRANVVGTRRFLVSRDLISRTEYYTWKYYPQEDGARSKDAGIWNDD